MKANDSINDFKTLQKLRDFKFEEDKTIIVEDISSSFSYKKTSSFKRLFKKIIDDFYPPRCYMCGKTKVNFDESFVCDNCIEIYKQYKVNKSFYDEVTKKEIGKSVYRYDGVVRYLVQKLKFNKDKKIAIALSELACDDLKEFLSHHHVNFMIPMPIHKDRLKERGFNQSDLIAKRFYEKTGLPYMTDVIGRTRYTAPQSQLANKDRAKNIAGSFEILKEDELFGMDVLIIDDVYTTGATINECKKALSETKVRNIYFFTIGVSSDQLKNEKNNLNNKND